MALKGSNITGEIECYKTVASDIARDFDRSQKEMIQVEEQLKQQSKQLSSLKQSQVRTIAKVETKFETKSEKQKQTIVELKKGLKRALADYYRSKISKLDTSQN